MKLWRRWGWIRRAFAGLSVAALLYFIVLVVVGLAQADFDRRTFMSEAEMVVHLQAGEARKVYLTAEESEALNFDFYPSDLTCEMKGPDGEVIEGHVLPDERRLLDGWRMHWGVASFTAPESGVYELLCRDFSDRSYPLLLATSSRYAPSNMPPSFGLFLFIVSLLMLGMALLVGRLRDRQRIPLSDS